MAPASIRYGREIGVQDVALLFTVGLKIFQARKRRLLFTHGRLRSGTTLLIAVCCVLFSICFVFQFADMNEQPRSTPDDLLVHSQEVVTLLADLEARPE